MDDVENAWLDGLDAFDDLEDIRKSIEANSLKIWLTMIQP